MDSAEALRFNLALQTKILARIQHISELKAINRRSARHFAAALRNQDGNSVSTSPSDRLINARQKELVAALARKRESGQAEEEDDSCSASGPPSPIESISKDYKARRSNNLGVVAGEREWRYNPKRKWLRRYFIDPDGSVPVPNADVVARVSLERDCSLTNLLSRDARTGKRTRTLSGKSSSGIIGKISPMKASERDRIYEVFVKNYGHPDWKEVANAVRSTEGGHSFPSAWDCFRQVQKSAALAAATASKDAAANAASTSFESCPLSLPLPQTLRKSSNASAPHAAHLWDDSEDAILLKSIAILGPQVVLNRNTVSDLTSRLLCDRTVKQTTARANASLANPNLTSDNWSTEEEQKLALCMRIYSKSPSALLKSYAHFPDRPSRAVAEKWFQSIGPGKREGDQASWL